MNEDERYERRYDLKDVAPPVQDIADAKIIEAKVHEAYRLLGEAWLLCDDKDTGGDPIWQDIRNTVADAHDYLMQNVSLVLKYSRELRERDPYNDGS